MIILVFHILLQHLLLQILEPSTLEPPFKDSTDGNCPGQRRAKLAFRYEKDT